jgi:hypothetical protein
MYLSTDKLMHFVVGVAVGVGFWQLLEQSFTLCAFLNSSCCNQMNRIDLAEELNWVMYHPTREVRSLFTGLTRMRSL